MSLPTRKDPIQKLPILGKSFPKKLEQNAAKKRRAFYESQLGNSLTVLFESENKEGYIHGFTENYVKVKSPWNPELVNTLQEVHLTEIDEDGLVRFQFVEKEVNSLI